MSVSAGRRILPQFCRSHLKKFPAQTGVVKFSSTAESTSPNLNCKNVPTSERISAAVLKDFDSPLVIDQIEIPKISQDNEVVIDVAYCALNTCDILLAKQLYTVKPCLPMVLGQELVGKLVQVGKDAQDCNYNVGDKVIALNKELYGGLSEQCIAKFDDIWKIPSEFKSIDAIGLLDDYICALLAIESKINLQEGDIIIINVGMSSIGLAAVDLATNVYKAEVIAVCATEEGADLARGKGNVLASFKYKDSKLLKQLQELATDKGIEAIFADQEGEHLKNILDCFTSIYKSGATMKDLLRDDSFAVVVHHLSSKGRAVIAGSTAVMTESDSNRFSVAGFNLKEYKELKPDKYREAGEDVIQFFEDGLIKPTCALTAGLCNVNDAVDHILKSKSPGKVIIDVKNKDAKVEKVEKQ
nr:quinone oxidoreductase-like protein 2 [Nomia melanderi]